MSKHNPNAWQDGFDAWQNGYNDAMYDGIDTSSEMPCKCADCLSVYDEGQEAAMKELFGGPSAQQGVQPTQPPYFEWTCTACGMRLPSTETHCPNCGGAGG